MSERVLVHAIMLEPRDGGVPFVTPERLEQMLREASEVFASVPLRFERGVRGDGRGVGHDTGP